MSLKHVKVGFSPMTGNIYLYRHGKSDLIAIEKREALQEVMVAASKHLLYGLTSKKNGTVAEIQVDGEPYTLMILPGPMPKLGKEQAPANKVNISFEPGPVEEVPFNQSPGVIERSSAEEKATQASPDTIAWLQLLMGRPGDVSVQAHGMIHKIRIDEDGTAHLIEKMPAP